MVDLDKEMNGNMDIKKEKKLKKKKNREKRKEVMGRRVLGL